jgi:hypothetical protein
MFRSRLGVETELAYQNFDVACKIGLQSKRYPTLAVTANILVW